MKLQTRRGAYFGIANGALRRPTHSRRTTQFDEAIELMLLECHRHDVRRAFADRTAPRPSPSEGPTSAAALGLQTIGTVLCERVRKAAV